MELLLSNYPPLKTKHKSFAQTFYGLIPQATQLDIAVGYVSTDALAELQKTVEYNDNLQRLNLIIGMHYFDKFTRPQYDAALRLNAYLQEHDTGEVRLVDAFRYHGKLYAYSSGGRPVACIVGSDNLGSIVEGGARLYETSLLLKEPAMLTQTTEFLRMLMDRATKNIVDCVISDFSSNERVLDGIDGVERVSAEELFAIGEARTATSFAIPLKVGERYGKSNLNVYFGKGRLSTSTGLIKPRHWYEVELIVPREIRQQPGYPLDLGEAGFWVITDDMWKFKCTVNGDYGKNLRSVRDLRILGRWLKGRLENAGVLQVGDAVTEATLRAYGRSTVTLTKTTLDNVWFLDFGVHST